MVNIEQVKERFKNAKEVRCPYDDKIFNLNANGFFKEDEGNVYFKFDEPQVDYVDDVYLYYEGKFAEIISYNKDVSETEKSEYPKVMLVSDDKTNWKQRVVFMEKNYNFITWRYCETIEQAKDIVKTNSWKFAKELPKEVEVTKEEIARWKGCDVEQLIIK